MTSSKDTGTNIGAEIGADVCQADITKEQGGFTETDISSLPPSRLMATTKLDMVKVYITPSAINIKVSDKSTRH